LDPQWKFPTPSKDSSLRSSDSDIKILDDDLEGPLTRPHDLHLITTNGKRSVSFFDVGGLLEEGPSPAAALAAATAERLRRADSSATPIDPLSSPITFPGTVKAQDHAPDMPASAQNPFAGGGADTAATSSPVEHAGAPRRSSLAFLSEIGGLLAMPLRSLRSEAVTEEGIEMNAGAAGQQQQPPLASNAEHTAAPSGVAPPVMERGNTVMSLQDVGGLLHGDRTDDGATVAAAANEPAGPEYSPASQGHEEPEPEPEHEHEQQQVPPTHPPPPQAARTTTDMSLQDVGGLLKK